MSLFELSFSEYAKKRGVACSCMRDLQKRHDEHDPSLRSFPYEGGVHKGPACRSIYTEWQTICRSSYESRKEPSS
jgi:hypothetical protein